jgi:hypothetical protein
MPIGTPENAEFTAERKDWKALCDGLPDEPLLGKRLPIFYETFSASKSAIESNGGPSRDTLLNWEKGAVKPTKLDNLFRAAKKVLIAHGCPENLAMSVGTWLARGLPPDGKTSGAEAKKKAPAAPGHIQENVEAVASKVSIVATESLQSDNPPGESEPPIARENDAKDVPGDHEDELDDWEEDWESQLPALDPVDLLRTRGCNESSPLMRMARRTRMKPDEQERDRRAQMVRELRRKDIFTLLWEQRKDWRTYFAGLSPEEQAALKSGELHLLRIGGSGRFVLMGKAEFAEFRLDRKLHPENFPPYERLSPEQFLIPPASTPEQSSEVLMDFIDGGLALVPSTRQTRSSVSSSGLFRPLSQLYTVVRACPSCLANSAWLRPLSVLSSTIRRAIVSLTGVRQQQPARKAAQE